MRGTADFIKVWIHRDPVDMRRSIDGLSAIVRNSMKLAVGDHRHLFVFSGRCRSRIKILHWDKTGFVVWYKLLEKSRFPWPFGDVSHIAIEPETLDYLLAGIDIFKIRPHERVNIAANW